VGVGGLVLLGLIDLGANQFDLLFDRRQAQPSCIGARLAVLEGSYEERYQYGEILVIFPERNGKANRKK
jgi:hypothetical protein